MKKTPTTTMIGLAMLANTALAGNEQGPQAHPLQSFDRLSPKILGIHNRQKDIDMFCSPFKNTDYFNECVADIDEKQKRAAEYKDGDPSSRVKAAIDALKANSYPKPEENAPSILNGSALRFLIEKCLYQPNAGRVGGRAPVFDTLEK
jgi:hypothetical protein